jgi:hypothetical protein
MSTLTLFSCVGLPIVAWLHLHGQADPPGQSLFPGGRPIAIQFMSYISLVQVIIKRCLKSCGLSRCVSHDLRDRLRGPVERVCDLVPFGNKLFDRSLEHYLRRKICDAETFPLQNRKPLLNLIHPRAMDGCEVQDEARRALQPWADCLAMRC